MPLRSGQELLGLHMTGLEEMYPSRPRKIVAAVNPWRLAAEAKRRGIEAVMFHELNDLVCDDKVFVCDVDELHRQLDAKLETFTLTFDEWPEGE